MTVRNMRVEEIRNREALGFSVALSFVCLAATRDVYLGRLFQRVSPSAVALVAFGACVSILLPVALVGYGDALGVLRRQASAIFWVNITSAVGWLSFLGSLRLIEPCLVQIFYFGVGPISVVWIDRYLLRTVALVTLTRAERPIFIGLLISLVFASIVVMNGLSGMGPQPIGKDMLGVSLALAGGVAMSVSTMQCRRLNDAGIRPGVLFSLRYPMTALAASVLVFMSPVGMSSTPPWISAAMAIAVLLILVPSYVNQVAISLASPLTVRVVVAGGPVIIFLLQTIEGRLSPSFYSLAAAMLYALFAILAGLARQRAIVATNSNRKDRSLDPSSLRQPLSADQDRVTISLNDPTSFLSPTPIAAGTPHKSPGAAIGASTICCESDHHMRPSAEINVLSSLATREAYLELVPQFERDSGRKVVTTWAGTVDIIKRISAGESFDLIIASNYAIDDLIQAGRVENGSRVDIARSGIGIAIRRGALRPDIRSAEALKRALIAAKTVGYSTGPSGVYLAALFERMGIAAEMKAKSRQVPPGATVGPTIANGDVEIGFQQMSELLHVDGVDVIGPLPAEIQHVTVISCGIPTAAKEPDAARALVRFLAAPGARDAIERAGLQPA